MMDAETQRRFDALEAQVQQLRGRQENKTRAATRGRRTAAIMLALFLTLVPFSLFAATPFTDLTGGVHDNNIDAIYNAGITTGCVPNQQYCPTELVTRQEMASFLARTAGLGSNPAVANARTVRGYTTAGLGGIAMSTAPIVTTVKNGSGGAVAAITITVDGNNANDAFVEVRGQFSAHSSTLGTLTANLRDTGTGNVSANAYYALSDPAKTGNNGSVSISWVFPAPGGQHTYQLIVTSSSADPATITDPVVIAISHPYSTFGAVDTRQP